MSKFKKRITIDQLAELTDDQKLKLNKLWTPEIGDFYHFHDDRNGADVNTIVCKENFAAVMFTKKNNSNTLPIMDIPMMIEMLETFNIVEIVKNPLCYVNGGPWNIRIDQNCTRQSMQNNLCDALWEAVKESL